MEQGGGNIGLSESKFPFPSLVSEFRWVDWQLKITTSQRIYICTYNIYSQREYETYILKEDKRFMNFDTLPTYHNSRLILTTPKKPLSQNVSSDCKKKDSTWDMNA